MAATPWIETSCLAKAVSEAWDRSMTTVSGPFAPAPNPSATRS
ncbi:hypothetical protein AB0E63_34460 [Kribbella sp. NPDC026596]